MRLFTLLLLLSASALHADVTLAPLFTDHVVLQRDKPLPIWGRADPDEHVTITLGGQSLGTTANADGHWLVYLDALPANAEPTELVVTGKNTVRIADVLVGEVWLCSGQSNMEWPVSKAQNAEQEIPAATLPLIRHVKIKRTVSEKPLEVVETEGWQTADPTTVADFTAVGYFFARDLQPRLKVPVGLINCTWGGTQVESWLSTAALASDPAFAVVNERWAKNLTDYPAAYDKYVTELALWEMASQEAKAAGKPEPGNKPRKPNGAGHHTTPAGLFNGMVNPLLPFALRGAIWYQGESNTGRPAEYRALFSAMISYWRKHFGQDNFPFLWVQLASFNGGDANATGWALLREAQEKSLDLPATGMATAVDIGDPDNIHPRNKQEVGRRLALIARAKVYDMPVDYSGPVFSGMEREGAVIRVRFNYAGTGLTAHEKPLQAFQIAGADKKFFPANARIEGETVVVSAPEVTEPVAVRYAWFNAPEANLYSGAGLPALPFRSDD